MNSGNEIGYGYWLLRWALIGAFFVAFGAGLFLFASPVFAQSAAASGVRSELMALAGPAVGIGVIWIGYMTIIGRGSVMMVVTFIVGAAIVLNGGML